MPFEKMTPLTEQEAGLRSGCLNCGPQPVLLPMTAWVAVGFGDAQVVKGDELIYSESQAGFDGGDDSECVVSRFEAMAAADPDHDWRIHYYGPLSEAHYQRQGAEQWVLYEKGDGFA